MCNFKSKNWEVLKLRENKDAKEYRKSRIPQRNSNNRKHKCNKITYTFSKFYVIRDIKHLGTSKNFIPCFQEIISFGLRSCLLPFLKYRHNLQTTVIKIPLSATVLTKIVQCTYIFNIFDREFLDLRITIQKFRRTYISVLSLSKNCRSF